MRNTSKKSAQVSEAETIWKGFLVDADAAGAMPFLDRAIQAKAHHDYDIVSEAWREGRTIVTSNGRDFTRHILEFQNPSNNQVCQDPFGVLVLLNAQLDRERG